jgi:hypothetical protein
MKPVIENEKLAAALTLLKEASGPMLSAQVAVKLHIDGGHETQRRRVREIIAELRARGHWIVGNSIDGVWMTKDPDIWKDYCDGKMIDGKRMIGEASRRKQAASGPPGQGLLFVAQTPSAVF